MNKDKSKYLVHPSNDMLLSAKILKDINGLNTSRPGKNWFVGFGAVLLISFIFLKHSSLSNIENVAAFVFSINAGFSFLLANDS